MRTSETVITWLAWHAGWDGDRYCKTCSEPLLMDISACGFDPRTGEQLHRRKGVCPRSGRFNLDGHVTNGSIIPPRPRPDVRTRPDPTLDERKGPTP